MKYASLLLITFVFYQCSFRNLNEIGETTCDEVAWKIAGLLNDYLLYDIESKLDTAMNILDTFSGKCPKHNANFLMRKLVIFSFKHDYQQGLEYAEKLNDTIVPSVYKFIVINRFKAMIAQEKGNIEAKNRYISEIIDSLEKELPEKEIDSVINLQNADSIMQYKKIIYLWQYYYYRSQLEGIDKINEYLDSKYKDNDDSYLWIIRPKDDDFMMFIGM